MAKSSDIITEQLSRCSNLQLLSQFLLDVLQRGSLNPSFVATLNDYSQPTNSVSNLYKVASTFFSTAAKPTRKSPTWAMGQSHSSSLLYYQRFEDVSLTTVKQVPLPFLPSIHNSPHRQLRVVPATNIWNKVVRTVHKIGGSFLRSKSLLCHWTLAHEMRHV